MTEVTEQADGTRRGGRTQWLLAIKLAMAALFLVWLFSSGRLDFSKLSEIRHTSHLAFAAIFLLASMVGPVWRWLWLARIQNLHVGHLPALRITWLGYFTGIFMPGAAGGDVAKTVLACKQSPGARMRALSTVLMDRVMGLHALLFLGAVAGSAMLLDGVSGRGAAVAGTPLILFLGTTIGLALFAWEPTSRVCLAMVPGRFRESLVDSLGLYRTGWRGLMWAWWFSVLCNLAAIAAFGFVASALGLGLTATQVLGTMPLVILANSLPITPGGLGVGETVGSGLLGVFGTSNGALVVLIVRLGVVLFSVPGVLALFGSWSAPERSPLPATAGGK